MSTPDTATVVPFTLPPVVCSVLTAVDSAFTALLSEITLFIAVVIAAASALLLTTVAREVSCVSPPFDAIASDTVLASVAFPFAESAVEMELAKLGLLPNAAAISASVFNCAGAPFSSVAILPSKYAVVALGANAADSADTLPFNALLAVCSDANEAAMAPDTDAMDASRVEVSVATAALVAV